MSLVAMDYYVGHVESVRAKKGRMPRVINFQNECDDALWKYWSAGHAENPR